MYSRQLIEHFEQPRNVGEIAQPDVRVRVENPACGDVMTLDLRVAEGRIIEAKYRVKGCVAAIGCGSALTEAVLGRSIEDARAIQPEHIVVRVGGLPAASEHASRLACDALHAALKELGK